MKDEQLSASLPVGPQDLASLQEERKHAAGACRLAIAARGCKVTLGRIRVSKDVYYRTSEEMEHAPAGLMRNRFTLGPGQYLMLGDNSAVSKDSRFWGPVGEDALIGAARWIYWPPQRWHEFQ